MEKRINQDKDDGNIKKDDEDIKERNKNIEVEKDINKNNENSRKEDKGIKGNDENTQEDDQAGLIDFINGQMNLSRINAATLSPLVLAFIGDGLYDLVIRTIVVERGNAPVNDLHRHTSDLVKAPAQARLYRNIKDELSPEEVRIFKRGRNAKTKTQAKNASRSSYRTATGVETLIGYLYLTNKFPRVLELIRLGLEEEN